MGTDKSLMHFNGHVRAVAAVATLLDSGVAEAVCLGGDRHALEALGLVVVPDGLPGAGPLAAVATGLAWAQRRGHASLLVIACDMPNLTAPLLASLAASLGDNECCVAESSHGIEPLCALYSIGCTPVFDRLVGEGQRSMRAGIAALRSHLVPIDDDNLVLNVNSPPDLA